MSKFSAAVFQLLCFNRVFEAARVLLNFYVLFDAVVAARYVIKTSYRVSSYLRSPILVRLYRGLDAERIWRAIRRIPIKRTAHQAALWRIRRHRHRPHHVRRCDRRQRRINTGHENPPKVCALSFQKPRACYWRAACDESSYGSNAAGSYRAVLTVSGVDLLFAQKNQCLHFQCCASQNFAPDDDAHVPKTELHAGSGAWNVEQPHLSHVKLLVLLFASATSTLYLPHVRHVYCSFMYTTILRFYSFLLLICIILVMI